MAQKSIKKRAEKLKRTKTVPIQKEESSDLAKNSFGQITNGQDQHYELHIEHASTTPEQKDFSSPTNLSAEKLKDLKQKQEALSTQRPSTAGYGAETGHGLGRASRGLGDPATKKVSTRVWNLLEWFATSALVFLVLFFAINFSSYSELIKSKLEKITGGYKLSPYIERIIGAEPTSQELLPVSTNPNESAQQIPPINIEVAPPDDRIIIPRINKNVPIVAVSTENLIRRDWGALETDIQEALRNGVVHYPGTAYPGDIGNVVITGHSSYFPWDPGRFKDVFALLHQVVVGDTLIVYHEQQKYTYEVYETKVVTPDKIEVLTQEGGNRLTLITCTPVGTNLKRLIVLARPVES